VDAQIGRVLEALEQSEKKDNTVVVLWSDHGWHIGEKEISGKNSLWDDSTRVPLIFSGPKVKSGQICNQPAELLDVYPTLIELCDLPGNEKLEGLSLLPQLEDANATRIRPAVTTHNQNNHGVRSEGWRFIQYADGTRELYDMRNDPNEWKNLAEDPKFKKVVEEHLQFLPPVNLPPAQGSRSRILTVEKDHVIWEGEKVYPKDPIPGI
jgi:arylsulfatase A-like enzyme